MRSAVFAKFGVILSRQLFYLSGKKRSQGAEFVREREVIPPDNESPHERQDGANNYEADHFANLPYRKGGCHPDVEDR